MAQADGQPKDGAQVEGRHQQARVSKNLLQAQDQFEMDLLKNGYQIAAGPGNALPKAKEFNRSGAKQENFIKTGK